MNCEPVLNFDFMNTDRGKYIDLFDNGSVVETNIYDSSLYRIGCGHAYSMVNVCSASRHTRKSPLSTTPSLGSVVDGQWKLLRAYVICLNAEDPDLNGFPP